MFFLNGEILMGYLSIATRPAVACALDFPRDYHRTQGRGVSFTPYLSIPSRHPFNVAFPSGKAERPIVKEIHHPLNLELRWDFSPRPIRLRRKAKIL